MLGKFKYVSCTTASKYPTICKDPAHPNCTPVINPQLLDSGDNESSGANKVHFLSSPCSSHFSSESESELNDIDHLLCDGKDEGEIDNEVNEGKSQHHYADNQPDLFPQIPMIIMQ